MTLLRVLIYGQTTARAGLLKLWVATPRGVARLLKACRKHMILFNHYK